MNEAAEKEVLISIIIATYNAATHLRDCLQSILLYAGKNTEIVVIDAGSNDGTIQLLASFNYPLFVWKSEEDKGIYDALNKGVRIAKGRWFHFLGADDRLLPGFSEIALLLKDERTVYYGNSLPDFGNRTDTFELLQGSFSKYRLAKYCMNHQSILYPATVFKKYKYDLRYKILADYALNLKVWGDGLFKKEFYPITIVKYNMSGVSSTDKDEVFKKDKPSLIKKNLGWIIYLRFVVKRFKKRKADNFI